MRRRLLILGYHGFQVRDEAAFRPILFMRPEVFQQRLDVLQKNGFPVITLNDALDRLQSNTLPDNSVVITIDDGFFSVLDLAAPILSRFNYPSTLYVTSYYVSKPSPIFRLAIQYLFWRTDKKEFSPVNSTWSPQTTVNLQSAETREDLIWKIIDYGEQHRSELERTAISREVSLQLGLDYDEIVDSRSLSLLDATELSSLKEYEIDIQSHTHRHEFPSNDTVKAERELSENLEYLSAQTGIRPVHFCYPSGIWNQSGYPVLEKSGIKSATTCQAGLNTTDTSPLALYRILDQDNLSQIEFEAELFGFSELLRIVRGQKKKVHEKHRLTH